MDCFVSESSNVDVGIILQNDLRVAHDKCLWGSFYRVRRFV